MKNNNSHPSHNERDIRTKTTKPKKNKKNARKCKKKDLSFVTEENSTESITKLQVEKIDPVSKENCKNVKAKNNIPKLEITMDCPISPPPTKSSPATPYQNQMQEKSTTQEEDFCLKNRNLPSTVSPAPRKVECETLESNSIDIENGSNKNNVGRETACVSLTDTLAKTLENPELLKLTNSLNTDDPYFNNTLDDVKNGSLEEAKVIHEDTRQNFFLPTATDWDVSNIEVVNDRTNLEPMAPISDYFNNKLDSTDELDAFKAETASIFQPDEENTILTPIDIQSITSSTKVTELNAIDKPAILTKRQQSIWQNNEFIVPPVVAGIDTEVNKKEYENTHNFELGSNLNNGENSSEISPISVNSDQGFDISSHTHTSEPATHTHLELGNKEINAKKSQEKIKADFINIAEVKRNVSSKNPLPNVEVEEKNCLIAAPFNNDAKFDSDERCTEEQVSGILISKQILNEENKFNNETNHELSENIAEAKTENRMGLEAEAGISVFSNSEVSGFIGIDLKKKDCVHVTDETETLSEREQAVSEEKSPKIDLKGSSKTSNEVLIAPSSLSIPAESLEEAAQKMIIEDIHTQGIKRDEQNNKHSNLDPNINQPNPSLPHLIYDLPTQAHIHEMGLSKDLIRQREPIGSKETSSTEFSSNQSPVVSRIFTESTLENSIIEPEYIKSPILQEDMASFLRVSNTNNVQKVTYRKSQQLPSNLNTPNFESNFDSESDLKSKGKNAGYAMITQATDENEAYRPEEDLDSNIQNIYRPTVGEQALAPELVIISKETLNHLHKKTALMQAEILRLSTALKNQINASDSKPIAIKTLTKLTLRNSELLENDNISAIQLPKLAKSQSSPRTKSLWGNLWPFGRRDIENSSSLNPQLVSRKGHPDPRSSVGEFTEPVTSKEIKRYKVIGRVRAKEIPGKDSVR
ncbi:hypothetical protein GcM3_114012 [Golovinomyces cichoracearum]|uniref:Uncharacterized protein n=1 Tax=Golovinomyces cichoracearum TaxID=62708 RepID=A0A420I8E2_9PEZI|nr:hypothetical protein GcM3_114012 [Golovinomyces cichoracearum]